ncbi:amino acid ABC transporter permease [Halococcus thailandensis]|uniref:Polar amino acid ABC transporter inner membrane protein n=1 Tax=Halococcus thailandensis JCM 13552 TaxID=1227457 RepID=M0N340_9EURY|nr:amino acid ABC transporter permease [Halococcus thailandensis]EMA52296.1 polar amino acid ABC transporter inner membrane protein [Halococcus thailandensis JCM 13552]
MSETGATRTTADTGRVVSGSLGRWLTIAGGVLFWGWLLARWLNNWFLPAGVGVPPGESFLDPAAVAPISDSLAFAVEYLPQLADAAWLTVVLTVVSIVLGFVFAVPVSVARVYGTYSSTVSLAFTELIRGTPLLAQLFVLYYALNLSTLFRGLPDDGFLPSAVVYVAIIGFTINSVAYQAEYIRSALLSVDREQLTAARAIGLSQRQGIRHVVLPQALRFAIPGWSNELVYLIKYSSLAAFITVPELFNVARSIAADNFAYTGIFALVAVLYLGLVISASKLMAGVERRVAIPGLGGTASQ